jgi:hypothetical protein
VSDRDKLIAAQAHVESLVILLEDNPYKSYMYSNLNTIKWELHRQLTNLDATDSIKE